MKDQCQEAKTSESWDRADIIAHLQREILPLQGYKNFSQNLNSGIGLRSIELAFPNATFPTGCIHEFISNSKQSAAATAGFIASVLGRLFQQNGICLWISASRILFPPALKVFGIDPDQFIFIDLKNENDILWTVEEALKCDRLAAVVGEIKKINFKESRRLQLASEQSRVTGFLLRHGISTSNTIASVARWQVTSLPSVLNDEMPGVGFPRWKVELAKVRNGKPGKWKVEWACDHFKIIEENAFSISREQSRKTG